ncbi:MAG TPA: fatty acid metabolism transcriptional regulator FadR [Anaerolineales bacterium]|nr:fatty acid metabolism transcriptional regulator FadR [Anaerolineales bacterium]
MDWEPVQKPAEIAESRLLEAILSGHFPINANLPGERELAEQIGVTRPTLREALQRLARDGWLDIQHGKATRVRDYWHEGGLGVLAVLAQTAVGLSPDFVTHLLELRVLLAPAYACQALEAASQEVAALLEGYASLNDTPRAFAQADWDLHIFLTQRAENPIFRFLFNGFQGISLPVGEKYFAFPECRRHSRGYYAELLGCARNGAVFDAESLTRRIMEESLALWQKLQK